jgi:hypothetical protein
MVDTGFVVTRLRAAYRACEFYRRRRAWSASIEWSVLITGVRGHGDIVAERTAPETPLPTMGSSQLPKLSVTTSSRRSPASHQGRALVPL